MPHVERRGPGRWRARYRTPDGQERSQTFARKVDAERFLSVVETNKLRGDFVDPAGGRKLFGAFVDEWVANHTQLRPSTLEQRESRLRNHVLPYFRDRPLGSITRTDIQIWVNDRAEAMAPSSLVVCYSYVSSAFKAA